MELVRDTIKAELKNQGRSNRYLIKKLKEDYNIKLNDAQISNRLNGSREFTVDEVAACCAILSIEPNKILSV